MIFFHCRRGSMLKSNYFRPRTAAARRMLAHGNFRRSPAGDGRRLAITVDKRSD